MVTTTARPGIYIDGRWHEGMGALLSVRAPYDNAVLAEIRQATSADVDHAIAAADRAFRADALSPYQRFEILNRAAALIKEREEDFARTLAAEAGKPLRDARAEVGRAIQTIQLSGEEAKRIYGETIPVAAAPGSANRRAFSVRRPAGVVVAISPFNFPLNLVCHKVGPALAAGCTVVLKPASATPLSSILLTEALADAGLPAGYLNLVIGPGGEVGEALLRDQRPAVYNFTGSAPVGLRLRQTVGLRRTILELGSNSATIIHSDADLEKAAGAAARGAFAFAGQVCISVQRLLVHESVRERFTTLFVGKVRAMKLGDPLEESTDVGPMIDEDAAKRAESWIEEARAGGAKILTGGKRNGSMLEPTVIENPTAGMKVICEEAFAPVVSILGYSTIDEAIAIANDSEFGLQAGLFTSDVSVVWRCADKLEVGGIIVNDSSAYRADLMPYGGVKNSGMGREGPRYAIEEMTDVKVVVFNL